MPFKRLDLAHEMFTTKSNFTVSSSTRTIQYPFGYSGKALELKQATCTVMQDGIRTMLSFIASAQVVTVKSLMTKPHFKLLTSKKRVLSTTDLVDDKFFKIQFL